MALWLMPCPHLALITTLLTTLVGIVYLEEMASDYF